MIKPKNFDDAFFEKYDHYACDCGNHDRKARVARRIQECGFAVFETLLMDSSDHDDDKWFVLFVKSSSKMLSAYSSDYNSGHKREVEKLTMLNEKKFLSLFGINNSYTIHGKKILNKNFGMKICTWKRLKDESMRKGDDVFGTECGEREIFERQYIDKPETPQDKFCRTCGGKIKYEK